MDHLLNEIEAFCRAHGVRESRFGRDAVNDTSLIPNLREGRELRRGTVEKVRRYMLTYGAQPASAEAA